MRMDSERRREERRKFNDISGQSSVVSGWWILVSHWQLAVSTQQSALSIQALKIFNKTTRRPTSSKNVQIWGAVP